MKTTIWINYKSGKTIKTTTVLTAKEIVQRMTDGDIDINPDNLSMICWSEVESISSDKPEDL